MGGRELLPQVTSFLSFFSLKWSNYLFVPVSTSAAFRSVTFRFSVNGTVLAEVSSFGFC